MIYNNKCFIHIPRTSGTYIERALCNQYNIKFNWPDPNLNNLVGLYKFDDSFWFTLQHSTRREVEFFIKNNLIKPVLKYKSVVRNPYDRFVSLFYHWGGYTRFENLSSFLTKLEDLDIKSHQDLGIKTENKDFNHLNMADNLENCKYHFISQTKYLINEKGQIDSDIVTFGDVAKIQEEFGISFSFDKDKNRLSRAKAIFELIDQELKYRIYDLYEEDFINFGYSRHFDARSRL